MSDKLCACCGNRVGCDCPTVQSAQFRRITELEGIVTAARTELRMKPDDSRTLAEACHDQRQATRVAIDEGYDAARKEKV